MLVLLRDRHELIERRWDMRFGQVAAAAINAAGGWKDRAAEPEDFFASLAPEGQTPEEQLAVLRFFTAAFGGSDLTAAEA